MSEADQVFAGLDIGSTKVTAVIGEFINEDLFQVHGGVSIKHDAIDNGAILKISELIDTIQKALDQLINETGHSFKWIMVGFSARSINCINSKGVTMIHNREGITQSEILSAIQTAIADSAIPVDRKSLHVIPQYYMIDKEHRAVDPIGMSARNLEAYVHTISCAYTDFENVTKCVQAQELRLNLRGIVLNSYIASQNVLREDERDLGALYIDMGSDFTDFIAYDEKQPYYTGVIPRGGRYITERMHERLRLQRKVAEDLKLVHGRAYAKESEKDEWFIMPIEGQGEPLEFRQYALSKLIQDEIEQIFREILKEITQREDIDKIKSGIVITGGSSLLPGIVDCAQLVFQKPARIGSVEGCQMNADVDGPEFVNAISLSKYLAKQDMDPNKSFEENKSKNRGSWLQKLWEGIKEFF